MVSGKEIVAKRLAEARKRIKNETGNEKYSQTGLGIAAGLDPSSASSRINHYETGRHSPNFTFVQKLAKLLEIPTSYMYTEEDELAELIEIYASLSATNRRKLLKFSKNL
jgi:transcriptional regulator with XRE-family HTH domain